VGADEAGTDLEKKDLSLLLARGGICTCTCGEENRDFAEAGCDFAGSLEVDVTAVGTEPLLELEPDADFWDESGREEEGTGGVSFREGGKEEVVSFPFSSFFLLLIEFENQSEKSLA